MLRFCSLNSPIQDFCSENPLLIYGWNEIFPDWRGPPIECDCWFHEPPHAQDCISNTRRDKTLVDGLSLPPLSNDHIAEFSTYFPSGVLSINGCDVTSGCKVQSIGLHSDKVSKYYVKDCVLDDFWVRAFEFPGFEMSSSHVQLSIAIENIDGPVSLESLYVRFGGNCSTFSVMFIGSVSVTVGFSVSALSVVYPRVQFVPRTAIDYTYFYKGVSSQFKSYDEFETIKPAVWVAFSSAIGLVDLRLDYRVHDVRAIFQLGYEEFVLFVPINYVPQVYLYNFIRTLCLSTDSAYYKACGFEPTLGFHSIEFMTCSDRMGMYCTTANVYQQFQRLFGLTHDDPLFIGFDSYMASYSNPMFIKSEWKHTGHHSLFKCAVCKHNKRIRRVDHTDFSRKFVRRVSTKLNCRQIPLEMFESSGNYMLFASKESYGCQLVGSASLAILHEVVLASTACHNVHGRVCLCFYGEIVDHDCSRNTLNRGIRYDVDFQEGVANIVHASRVVARIFPGQISDLSMRGVASLMSSYFSRVIIAEPMEAAFSNNLARILRDRLLEPLFQCESSLIPECLSIIIRSLMSNSSISADVVDALSTLLKDEVVAEGRYIVFVRRFLVGIVVLASSVMDFIIGVGLEYSTSLYLSSIPIVVAMLVGGVTSSVDEKTIDVCRVLSIPQFSFSEFLSWMRDLNFAFV